MSPLTIVGTIPVSYTHLVGRFLEVDIAVGLGGINILIGVAVFFSLVMLLNFRHIVEGGQALIAIL